MRLLVHEPMNTVSTGISRIGVPADRPMYSSARAAASRPAASEASSGDGTAPSNGATWPGLVPQVTCGGMSAPSRCTSVSKLTPSSLRSERQCSTAVSQAAPVGAWGRPWR